MAKIEKITVVSMVKNEEEIIESSIRYWLSFSDMVMIYDHYSTDGTRKILEALKEEFSDRIDFYVPDFHVGIEYVQKEITDGMIRKAFLRCGADLVIPLDADEYPFLTAGSSASVRQYLCGLDQDHGYFTNWVPFSCDDAATADAADRISRFMPLSYRTKRAGPITRYRKYLITGEQYRRDPISVTKGNHGIYRPSGNDLPPVIDISPSFCYAHYMFRGVSHLKIKVAAGWIANYSDIRWNGDSRHYQAILGMLKSGTVGPQTVRWANLTCSGLTGEDAENVAVETISPQDMFGVIPALKYTDRYRQNKDEFAKLLDLCLMLVEQYREAQKALTGLRS